MKKSSQEIIDVIDSQNRVIGSCIKDEIYSKNHLHRIVHVLIFNDKGEMLLQLRSKNKSYLPGYWGTSVGGHVMSGETPEQAALREMEEELGVKLEIEPFTKDWFDSTDEIGLRKLLFTFKASSCGPFKHFGKEIERTEFIPLEKIKKMIAAGDKIHPELKFLMKKYFFNLT